MNEHIRELAIKAQVEHCISHVRLKEFSDLIIKECIKICEDGTDTQTTSGGAAILIKQRFGIKENDIQ
jgi:hypothetical protein